MLYPLVADENLFERQICGFVLVQICYAAVVHLVCVEKNVESEWSGDVPIVVAHDSMT